MYTVEAYTDTESSKRKNRDSYTLRRVPNTIAKVPEKVLSLNISSSVKLYSLFKFVESKIVFELAGG